MVPPLICNFLFRLRGINIEFRDSYNLSTTLEVLSLDPCEPYALCSNKHTLYYADWKNLQVKELDCLTSPPKLVHQNSLTVDTRVTDMCIVKNTLIAVDLDRRIKIYNMSSKALECDVPCTLPERAKQINLNSVTSTRLGHIFVSDRNNHCIHMFDLNEDDKYMGVLFKAGDLGLEEPYTIRWCEKASSLIVAHKISGKISVSTVKVQ